MSDFPINPGDQDPDLDRMAALFPGYQFIEKVGAGRLGVVFHARQVSLDRDVAIKILPGEILEDPEFHDRFTASVMAMAQLNHPNLISIFDFGEIEDRLFVVMEFVPGISLAQLVFSGPMDPEQAARITAAVCDGLANAHEHGLVHRDITPAAIRMTPGGEPKIGDFDLAPHQAGAGAEFFPYSAPELLAAPDQADARADIYSMGVILHELLTGSLPTSDPRPPSAVVGCDLRFDEIVRRAVDPSPETRYPDAATMAGELRELLEAMEAPRLRAASPSAEPSTISRPTLTSATSSSSNTILWVVVFIALGIGGLVFWAVSNNSGGNTATAPTSSQVRTPVPPTEPGKTTPARPPDSGGATPQSPAEPPPEKPVAPTEPTEPLPPPSEMAGQPPQPEPSTEPAPPDSETPPANPDAEPAPSPKDPATTAAIAPLRQKARQLIAKAIAERDKALEDNANRFKWDLDVWLRSLGRTAQSAWASHVATLINKVDGNRVPEAVAPEEGIQFSQQMMTIATRSADKQKEIDAAFATKLERIRDAYLKRLATQLTQAQQAGNKDAAEQIQEAIQEAEVDADELPRVFEVEE